MKDIPSDLGELAVRPSYIIFPLADQDKDGFEEIILMQADGISILYSGTRYDHHTATMVRWKFPYDYFMRIGGIGDYTGDSIPDFWVVEYGQSRLNPGKAILIDGAALLDDAGSSPNDLSNFKLLEFTGIKEMLRPSKNGIGSSISRNAGDFDGDGIADFSIASHYELDYTGTLYIIPGSYIWMKNYFSINAQIDY